MNPQLIKSAIRHWSPSVLGLVAVIGAIVFAVNRSVAAHRDINDLLSVSEQLDSAASIMCAATRAPEETREAGEMQEELRTRVREACMPALVQAELMNTAREAELDVKEIQPVSSPLRSQESGADPIHPSYRVQVLGTYQQFAVFMELCKTQRLPARVNMFRINRTTENDGSPARLLTADITVESYRPPEGAVKLARG